MTKVEPTIADELDAIIKRLDEAEKEFTAKMNAINTVQTSNSQEENVEQN